MVGCWHCPQTHLYQGNAGDCTGRLLGSVLTKSPVQIHQYRFSVVRHWDCYSCTFTSAVGTMESFQAQPCLCMCPPTKFAAATMGPTPAVGAQITHPEVHQVLSSQIGHWWCKFWITASGPWLRFQSFFLNYAAPGHRLRFQPRLCLWTTHHCLHTGALPAVRMLKMRLLWWGYVLSFILVITIGLLWWTRAPPIYTLGCCLDRTPDPSGCFHGAIPSTLPWSLFWSSDFCTPAD